MAEMALFLAVILAISAVHKVAQPTRLTQAMAKLSGISADLAPSVILGIAALEFLTALALIFEQSRVIGAAFATLIWLAYGLALLRKSGTSLDCGCDLAAREKPVGPFMISRALVLSGLALLVTQFPSPQPTIISGFAVAGLLSLYVALGELIANPSVPERRPSI